MQMYRVFPTLDMFIDVMAGSEDEALAKVDEMAKSVIDECAQKLFELGFTDDRSGIFDNLEDE